MTSSDRRQLVSLSSVGGLCSLPCPSTPGPGVCFSPILMSCVHMHTVMSCVCVYDVMYVCDVRCAPVHACVPYIHSRVHLPVMVSLLLIYLCFVHTAETVRRSPHLHVSAGV